MTAVHLTSARTRMSPPSADDAALVADYYERNEDHLGRWESTRPEGFFTTSFWQTQLVKNLEASDARTELRLFIRSIEKPSPILGSINFVNVVGAAFCACHLGYSLDKNAQGQGLMFEALSVAIPAAAAHLGLHRVMANYQPTNERSGRLLRRLGFQVEGYARDYLRIDGEWRDHILTSWTNPEFG